MPYGFGLPLAGRIGRAIMGGPSSKMMYRERCSWCKSAQCRFNRDAVSPRFSTTGARQRLPVDCTRQSPHRETIPSPTRPRRHRGFILHF